MPLYIADYRADTMRLSTLEHGVYLLLIMEYWDKGSLPDDDAQLAEIAGLSDKDWIRIRDRIRRFFHSGWKHKRIEAELAKAADLSSKRKASAEQRWANRGADTHESVANPAPSRSRADANALHLQSESNANAMQTQCKTDAIGMHRARAVQSQSQSSLREDKRARDGAFQQFWTSWPHKVGKPTAERAFAKCWRELPAILAGLDRYVRAKPPHQAWLNPATFLNQRRWEDEPGAISGAGPPRRGDALAQELAEIYRQEAEDGERYGAEAQGGLGDVLRLAEPPMVDREDGPNSLGLPTGHCDIPHGRAGQGVLEPASPSRLPPVER
ncbi:YdaU family protein [Methylocystis bryophila]|nr:DUF1376 domain-containing protein [Methylocystis bryophila]